MAYRNWFGRHRYVAQVCATAIVSTACALAADALDFRSFANLAWMIGVPIVVALAANEGWDRRCFMVMALPVVSIVVSTIVGVNFTSYG